MRFEKNVDLAKLTTLEVGGRAKYLVTACTKQEFAKAIGWAKEKNVEWVVIGEGSNLLVSDDGYNGLVIVNKIDLIERDGGKIKVGAGTNLNQLVDYVNAVGLAGMECLAGIPGTVGGAVYGNAGAYGQTISDCLVGVQTLSKLWLKSECGFGYRESNFKRNKEVIVEIQFGLVSERPEVLQDKSVEIRTLREKKYPKWLKCPGSFFKNLFFEQLPEEARKQIPEEKIKGGKVAAGYLLELVGARGMRMGGARVADYHGNLIYNVGGAKSDEVWKLAQKLQNLVQDRFGVTLEPEVQLVGRF